MDFKDFYAGQNDDDRRLDKIIRKFAETLKLSEIYKALRKGLIKVNDKKASAEYRIKKGDKISIAAFLLENKVEKPVAAKDSSAIKHTQKASLPPVIFQNQHLLVLNKPAGINVHGKNSLEEIVREYYQENNSSASLSFTTGPLHRLDKMTTGLLAFSWSLEGARWFSENIKLHVITKKYLGLVHGKLSSVEEWKDNISKQEEVPNRQSFHKMEKISSGAAFEDKTTLAWTTAQPVSYGTWKNQPVTLVCFNIHTGKQHQIRLQSSIHGHPLLGDTAYNGTKIDEKHTIFLHAYKLIFPENPVGLPPELTAPLPEDFLDFVSKTCNMKNFEL